VLEARSERGRVRREVVVGVERRTTKVMGITWGGCQLKWLV
jgi:hypothetical protein